MNGIEKITDRIAVDADQEAKALLDSAKKQAAEITASYEALAQSNYDEAIAKGKADAADRIERLASVADLDARKLRLQNKQALLEKAFSQALEKLQALPEDQYVALLAKLAAEGCSTGKESLVLSTTDKDRYGQRVVTAANALLVKSGKTGALTLSEESREFSGGLYIKDGNIENNCTFPTIIRMLREQMAGDVAKVLFD